MPDNEYKLPILSVTEFEAALDKYIEWVKSQSKSGFLGQQLNLKELKKYYSDLIARQGVGEWLPNYQDILAIGAPERLSYDIQRQYQGKVIDWQGDVDKAYQKYYSEMTDWAKMQENTRQFGIEQQFKEKALEAQKQEARDIAQQRSWEQLNEADKARWTAQAEASRFETQRMMNIFTDVQAQREELDRQQSEMKWEAMRQDILSSVQGSPRNWIQASRAATMQNPYTKEPENFQQNLDQLREDYRNVKQAASDVRNKINDSQNTGYTWQNIASPKTTDQQMAAIILNAEKDITSKLNEANVAWIRGKGYGDFAPETEVNPDIQAEATEDAKWATPRPTAFGNFEAGKPNAGVDTRIKIPEWLQKASGGLEYVPPQGTRVPILTPSGQSWSALSPTQQSMYAGFVDVSGKRSFEDIDWERQIMQPRTPTLGRNWEPARQMV